VKNVYTVKLAVPVKTEPAVHGFSGKSSTYLYVVASSFDNALKAVAAKYPDSEVRGIDMLNYAGVPIVAGD
jgi:hypothetical protein